MRMNSRRSTTRSVFSPHYNKPVILAEAGIDAVRGEKGFDFGEERQLEYHAKLQALLCELIKECCLQGMALFVLSDFKTPIKLGRFQRGYNRKGLVYENLLAKPAFATVRDGYAKIAKMLTLVLSANFATEW